MSAEEKAQVVSVLRVVSKEDLGAKAAREEVRALLEDIVVGVVGTRMNISVTYNAGEYTTVYRAECSHESMGRLIGAKGRNINAIRTVLTAVAACHGLRAILEIPYIPLEEK